jgi:NTP pyrophosphohydrolases containing a Zn-finger, probably nucleic-acid-binding
MKSAKYKGKPMSFMEFAEKYATEDACRQKVFEARWSNGFVCPKCGGTKYCYRTGENAYQCNKCKHKTTPKVGTLMEKSPLPYKTWLWAIYLVAVDKRGISAMALMRQLHVTYKTAWYLLHRIREAMGNRDEKYLLDGIVEFDDSYFGGTHQGGKRGRGTDKSKVLMAVSKDNKGIAKYMKLRVVPNLKGPTIGKFVKAVIAEGSTIETDALHSYRKALSEKHNHSWAVFDTEKEMLVWLHTILSNVKEDILGTFHGVSKKHLQRYLDEIAYRFNRRFMQPVLFDHLLAAVTSAPPLGLERLTG